MQYTKQECQDFWKNAKGSNDAENYLGNTKTKKRSDYLVNLFIKLNIPKNYSILELGCNCGRNLNSLLKSGWENLSGIDINPKSLELMEKEYPELAKDRHFYEGSIEEYLCKYEHKFEVIFSMATLMHLPPVSQLVFDLIKYKALKYIITIEYESSTDCQHPYIWSHDYRRMLYDPENWGLHSFEEIDEILPNYICRIFKRIEKNK